ncbi:Uncharacterized protein DBV15_11421, partial [Temnothorax longispinosus]
MELARVLWIYVLLAVVYVNLVDGANVTQDERANISLSPLTTIMSPRRNNLEHFTRDTRSPPVGSCVARHAWQGCNLFAELVPETIGQETRSSFVHDWCSSTEYLEMNNGQPVIPLPRCDVLARSVPTGRGFTAFRERCRRRCESARKLGARHLAQVERRGREKEESRRNGERLPRTALRRGYRLSAEERRLKSLPERRDSSHPPLTANRYGELERERERERERESN